MALTNKELYEAITGVRQEIQKDIAVLRAEVTKIETSRISKLETDITVLKTKMMFISAGTGILVSIATSIIISIATRAS